MTNQQRMKRIEKAQLRVLFHCPFFAPGVAKLENQIIGAKEAAALFGLNPAQWTACTDGTTIKWFEGFLDSLRQEEIPTVLCHECWHCLAGHLWRAPEGVDWEKWNIAADHETNMMLKEFSAKSGRRPDPFPFPQPEDRFCANPKYSGWAVEAIYADLPSSGGQNPGQGGKVAPAGSQTGKNPGSEAFSMPSFGQMARPLQSAGQKALAQDWTATLLQSAKMAQAGSLPGNLEKLVQGIVSPKLNWKEILRSWLREQVATDWDWMAPAMEYEGCGFILPSLNGERLGPVVFGSDWSGSTYGELVEAFHAEKQNALDDLKPSKLIDIGFDTRVIWEKEYSPGDEIDKRIAGGGGTSFVDVLRRCGELRPEPKAVVILTDLEGEFPSQAPPFPVIWVNYGRKENKAPFGETIHVE
jgi:predicted metal-dependent peptidase